MGRIAPWQCYKLTLQEGFQTTACQHQHTVLKEKTQKQRTVLMEWTQQQHTMLKE